MTKSTSSIFLSLVIPVYHCNTIRQDILDIVKICKKLHQPFEIICVVDGLKNQQDTTLSEVKKIHEPFFSYIFLPKNKGKGFAVRQGFAQAKGKYRGFIDAGHDIEPDGILTAVHTLKKHKADAVIGNKQNTQSEISYPFIRKLYSSVLQHLVQTFLHLPFADTQVGLKIFSAKMLDTILPMLTINRWAFDLELLAIAHQKGFRNIRQFPIKITYNYATNISIRDAIHFLGEFFVIMYRIQQSNDE